MLASSLSFNDRAWPIIHPDQEWTRYAQAALSIGAAAIETASLGELMHDVHAHLQCVLGAEHCALALMDDAAGQLIYRVDSAEVVVTDLLEDNSLMAHVVRQRQPASTLDAVPCAEATMLAPGLPVPAAYLVLPLLAQGRVTGVLAVGSATPGVFDHTALGFVNLIAATLTLAVEKARLYETMPRYTQSLEERVVAHTVALESEKMRFESIVQSLGEGLILIDLNETVTFANQHAQVLLGLPLEALAGLTITELWRTPELCLQNVEQISRDFTQALHQVEAYPDFNVSRLALTGSDPAGATTPQDLRLRLFPVRDSAGALFNYGLTVQDITREREMDRMKDELVNVVSHELRTPLASVLGFAELLLSRDFPESRRRTLIETIHKEAERLTGLINDFLDLRRLESGRQEMTFADVAVAEVVHNAVAGFAVNQTTHTFEIDAPASLPLVRADAGRLGTALRNLIGNALKYSPAGGRIRVRAAQRGQEVRLMVTDDGLGLPAEVIPQLFQRFYRVDSSDRRTIGGTGLGLAIVKEIVAAHGGRVWAESAGPGAGSTFGLTVPLARYSLRRDAVGEALPRLPEGAYVLIVEDDAGQITLIEEHLRAVPLPVVSVSGPRQALRVLQQRLPLGVIMDVCLPEAADGWALLDDIRRAYSPTQLPVIVTTVLEERTRGLAAGATEYLVKPYDPRQLLTHLPLQASTEVLVVEDETLISTLVSALLNKIGYRVQAVPDGLAALTQLAHRWPDVMIVDLLMPRLDGFALVERVRALPEGRDLPVLVMTAADLRPEQTRHLQQLGAFILPKAAYSAVRLRSAIETALRERRCESPDGKESV
jgi:PAS domain S-box-containing protein